MRFFGKKKKLIIIGARGWGREVLWAVESNKSSFGMTVKGFLDDDVHALDGLNGKFPPILSSVEDYEVCTDDLFFCALGDADVRKHYAEIIERKGGRFVSIIHPKASVSPNAVIGDGSYIDENVTLSDNVHVGRHAIVQRLSTLGHDMKIGDYVTIGAYTFCGGNSSVGDCSTLHVRTTLLHNVNVGTNAVVGAGSVVIKKVKDGDHVFGNPAKRIW